MEPEVFYIGGSRMTSSMKKPVGVSEKEYLASGDWKCPDSPTGAHWWNCNVQPSVCKVCGKVKLQSRW
jgi:hypothetical protein